MRTRYYEINHDDLRGVFKIVLTNPKELLPCECYIWLNDKWVTATKRCLVAIAFGHARYLLMDELNKKGIRN